LLAGAVLLVDDALSLVLVTAALVVLTGLAMRCASPASIDAVLTTDLLYLAVNVGVLGLWPLPAAVAVVVAWVLARRQPRAKLWRSWLRRGHHTPETVWLLLAVVVGTGFALVGWQRMFDGQLPDAYRDVAAGHSVWLILIAGSAFAVLNAAVEEAIFRGVFQTSLQASIGPTGAILIQAAAFALLHVVGIPTGLIGALMAGSWGILLGVLRCRTRGILAPYLAHVAADLTIVAIMVPTLV
jgi:membrane protease YdiL (CAAX protease family)